MIIRTTSLKFRMIILAVLVLYHANNSHAQTRQHNQLVLEINPRPDNPRNSEGAFIELKDGRILYVYSRFQGTKGNDHAPAQLAGRYSSDGGRSWSPEDQLIVGKEGS